MYIASQMIRFAEKTCNDLKDNPHQVFLKIPALLGKFGGSKRDLNVVQKTAQIAIQILKMCVPYFPASTLTLILSTVYFHDPIGLLQFPFQVIFPVTKDTIDREKQKNAIITALRDCTKKKDAQMPTLPREIEDEGKGLSRQQPSSSVVELQRFMSFSDDEHCNAVVSGEEDWNVLYSIADQLLTEILSRPAKDHHYTASQFQEKLYASIGGKLDKHGYEWRCVEGNAKLPVEICYKATPIEQINFWMWSGLNFSCLGLYLQSWDFIDITKWSLRVGEYTVFQDIAIANVEKGITGLAGLCFGVKCLAAFQRRFSKDAADDTLLADNIKLNAEWDIVSALPETLWNCAVLAGMLGMTSFTPWGSFYIATKIVGIVSILFKE